MQNKVDKDFLADFIDTLPALWGDYASHQHKIVVHPNILSGSLVSPFTNIYIRIKKEEMFITISSSKDFVSKVIMTYFRYVFGKLPSAQVVYF